MPISKTCLQCNREFRVKPRSSNQKCCSWACHKLYETAHGRAAARKEPVIFICRACGKPFNIKPAYLTAYRKKFEKDPLYCSRTCNGVGQRQNADERHKTTCKNCGKEFYRTRRKGSGTIYATQQLCSRPCKNAWTSKIYRAKHGTPVVTKRIKRNYVLLRIPTEGGERAYREVLEHRYVMEQHIGRPLTDEETVHHIDGDRQHNNISNLELCATNHGPGQAVTDIVAWCIKMLRLYPEFAQTAGVELRELEAHVSGADPGLHLRLR